LPISLLNFERFRLGFRAIRRARFVALHLADTPALLDLFFFLKTDSYTRVLVPKTLDTLTGEDVIDDNAQLDAQSSARHLIRN